MKRLLIVLLSLITAIISSAQSYEGTIEYDKKDRKATIIEFPYAPSVVENAIIEKMENLGYKKKQSKGFLVYKNAVIKAISSEPADYMIKVEAKSRKEKDESIVYLIMNEGEESITLKDEALLIGSMKIFLNEMSPHVEAFSLEKGIQGQEASVAKAEKRLKDMKEDQEIIEKKIKKLQEDLKDNAKDQEKQLKEIKNQKLTLETMKGKRKIL